MTLHNTIVQITITIPKLELEALTLSSGREVVHDAALEQLDGSGVVSNNHIATFKILDCPSYPALNE